MPDRKNIWKHIEKINKELGVTQKDIAVLKNDMKWIKNEMQTQSRRQWMIVTGIIITSLIGIISLLI